MGHEDGAPPRPLGEQIGFGPETVIGATDLSGPVFVLSVPRCATCVHWDKYPRIEFGRCNGITDESQRAWFEPDRSGYVVTLPDFGCINHLPAPTDTGSDEP